MTRSKSNVARPSCLYPSSTMSSPSTPNSIHDEVEPVAQNTVKMDLLSMPPSKLRRLSQYLPKVILTQAKPPQDQEHAVLRKHAPFDFEQESQAPPSRPPPSAPVPHASTIPPPLSTTNHPHKLQKQGTLPKELPRLPASPYLPGRDGSVSPHNMEGRRRGNSLLPAAAAPGSPRSVSTPQAIRPKSANLDSELDNKTRRRSSWLPGKPRSRKSSQDLGQGQVLSAAWVSAGGHHIDYNLKFLVGGDKVSCGKHAERWLLIWVDT